MRRKENNDQLSEITDIYRWAKLAEEEISVNSDRSLIITVASILEMQLEKILKLFLISDSKINERLFDSYAPLSEFESKISVCYYLGLISKYEYNTLNTIRRIRNQLAHEIEIKRFSDSQSIMDLCNNLTIPNGFYIPEYAYLNGSGEMCFEIENFSKIDTIQEKIIEVFKHLTIYLEQRRLEVLQRKVNEYITTPFIENIKANKDNIIDINEKSYKECLDAKIIIEGMLDEESAKVIPKEVLDNAKTLLKTVEAGIEFFEKGKLFVGTVKDSEFGLTSLTEPLDNLIDALKRNSIPDEDD